MNEAKIPFSRIRELCEEEGIFSVATITPPERLNSSGLDDLLNDGIGDMNFLAEHRELKLHPVQMLAGCKTIIVSSIAYSPHKQRDDPLRARYAAGKDYHRIIRRKLSRVGAKLLGANGEQYVYRATVDSAPVMERTLATMGGLGWAGKNGLLIHPQRGSYSFIGVLFTTAQIEITHQEFGKNRCGSCSSCISKCPTDAIQNGRVISERCISYLTIEHKGTIPRHLAEKFAGWWFGCDICQEVCPWNDKFSIEAEDERFLGKTQENLLTVNSDNFDEHFAGSAIRRIGYERFRRNLLVSYWSLGQRDSYQEILSEGLPIVISQADELDLRLPL